LQREVKLEDSSFLTPFFKFFSFLLKIINYFLKFLKNFYKLKTPFTALMIWKGRISDFTKYFSAPKALARSLSTSPERAEITITEIFGGFIF